mgnify:CR=1 FL=1
MGQQRITVAELFAGVGGFRLGLEGEDFEFVWSNQFEPGEKAQWAARGKGDLKLEGAGGDEQAGVVACGELHAASVRRAGEEQIPRSTHHTRVRMISPAPAAHSLALCDP